MEALAAGALAALVLVGVTGVVVGRELAGTDSTAGTAGTSTAAEARAFVATQIDTRIIPTLGAGTEVLKLELPPGAYQVFGEIGLHNRDASSPLRAQCVLVPSNEDGSSPPIGAPGQDVGFLHLAQVGEPGEQGHISVSVSQELSRAGAVVLTCSGYGADEGAFVNYGSLRAIEVGSIAETGAGAGKSASMPDPLPG